jgi:DNA polymerase (family 10)
VDTARAAGGGGESEAAQERKLPRLIELEDPKGDLQSHSTWSDGRFTIEQMAEEARERGLRYLAVTDHSQGLGIARGLTPERVHEQWREIDALNRRWSDFVVLKGVELEIRADGTLDFPDDLLAQFDLVLAATHSALKQSRQKITARVLKAARNPPPPSISLPTRPDASWGSATRRRSISTRCSA